MTLPEGVEIRPARDVDDVLAAGHLFDGPPIREATEKFLATDGHHLLLAFLDGKAVGMVTGMELTMPDKGTEMFLDEMGVDEAARGRGIGTALAVALGALARERGCYDMWVLTDHDNDAALGAYRSSGADQTETTTLLLWDFEKPGSGPG